MKTHRKDVLYYFLWIIILAVGIIAGYGIGKLTLAGVGETQQAIGYAVGIIAGFAFIGGTYAVLSKFMHTEEN